jgi:hypothetical protein
MRLSLIKGSNKVVDKLSFFMKNSGGVWSNVELKKKKEEEGYYFEIEID